MKDFLGNPPARHSTEAPRIANRTVPDPETPTEPSPGIFRVERRIHANGHDVFGVMDQGGLTRTVVLWDDDSAEVFLDSRRYVGRWALDADGDVRVNVAGGVFAFRRG